MEQNQLFDAAVAQDVRSFFEHIVENAQKFLLAEGRIVHACWLFCPTASVLAHKGEFKFDSSIPLNENNDPPRSIITVHLAVTSKELLEMAGKLYPAMVPGARALADILQRVGGLEEDAAAQRVLKSLLTHLRIDEGVLVLEYLHFLIKRLDAFAFVLQSEGLMLNFDLADPKNAERAKSITAQVLQTDPDARSALLVQMESPIEKRLMSVPFQREEGKAPALGKPIEMTNYQGGFNAGLKKQVMN